jgi:hypothetical protein
VSPIERCFARIDHARALADRLGEMTSGLELPDGTLAFEGELVAGGRLRGVVLSDVVLPIEVSFVFGDAIHNLRAALDNFAWALAEKASDEPSRWTSFPIVIDENKWNTQRRGCLSDVEEVAVEYIRSHQPFMRLNPFKVPGGIPPERNVLARIAEYSNADKHRAPTVLGGYATEAVERSVHIVGCQLTLEPRETDLVAMRAGAVVVEYVVDEVDDDAEVDVRGEMSWIPSLDNGEHVMRFIDLAHAYVHDLLVDGQQYL